MKRAVFVALVVVVAGCGAGSKSESAPTSKQVVELMGTRHVCKPLGPDTDAATKGGVKCTRGANTVTVWAYPSKAKMRLAESNDHERSCIALQKVDDLVAGLGLGDLGSSGPSYVVRGPTWFAAGGTTTDLVESVAVKMDARLISKTCKG